MTERVLRVISALPNDMRYADPLNLNNSVRVTLQTKAKMAGDLKTTNSRAEVISQHDLVHVADPACDNGCINGARTESLSIRVIISGSIENKALVSQMWTDAAANVTALLPDLTSGFPPAPSTNLRIDVGTTE